MGLVVAGGAVATQGQAAAKVGTALLGPLFPNLGVSFFYDALSSAFHVILFLALTTCLLFIFAYFEYDFSSVQIVTLSSLFSQLALAYFASGDLFVLLFF